MANRALTISFLPLVTSARVAFACIPTILLIFLLPVISFSQTPRSRVTGVVRDERGAVISEAEVRLISGSVVLARDATDSAGRFQLEIDSRRAVKVAVEKPGFARFELTVDLPNGNSLELDALLSPASISEEVTTISTRTETRIGDTPASIVSLSIAELSITGALTLDDALRQVPGFTLFRRTGSRAANPTTQGISLRGVGASGASRAVVLADGIPQNDPFGGWVYWSRVPRSSIQNVEILRGGASHLYGSSALGGVVDIRTRRPSNQLDFEASYGTQETFDSSIFASLQRRGWGASVAASMFRTDGYVIVNEDQRGTIDIPANTRNGSVRLTLERQLGDDRVFATGSYFGEARSNGTPFQTNRTHIRQIVFGADLQEDRIGAVTARLYGGTQTFDQNFSAVSSDRSTEALTRIQRVPAQSVGVSVQWSRPLLTRHTFVAGFDGREVRGASDEIVLFAGRASSLVGAGGRERTTGFFFEDVVRLGDRFYLTAGARFDHWRNFSSSSVSRVLSTGTVTSTPFTDRTESAFSPHLSLLHKLTHRFSVYASIDRSFRQPTLNELYRSFRVGDVFTLANENPRAERATGGEAGLSATAFERRLNIRGAFFWTEVARPVANVTLSVQPTLITRQRQNLGRIRSLGGELEWEARLSNRWTVSGGYLLVDASVLEFPANTALEGLTIPQVARHQLTVQARYHDPSVVTLGLQARASSSQFDDDQNLLRLGRYFTLDAHASRNFAEHFSLFAAAENVFNTRYDVGLTPVKTIGPPALVRGGFRLTWD